MDDQSKRKVSPRAPTMALDDAVERAHRMYNEEGKHPTQVDVAFKHIGYNSKNGAAMQAMASLGYWGLIERPRDGYVMVSKAAEDYQFTPDESHKKELLISFLRKPKIFSTLLDKYQDRLPSDASIRYELIQLGFTPAAADACLAVFKRSVEFAGYFDRGGDQKAERKAESSLVEVKETIEEGDLALNEQPSLRNQELQRNSNQAAKLSGGGQDEMYRVPVRLTGGRTAWIEFPTPFYSADKIHLKKYIDLQITEDELLSEGMPSK